MQTWGPNTLAWSAAGRRRGDGGGHVRGGERRPPVGGAEPGTRSSRRSSTRRWPGGRTCQAADRPGGLRPHRRRAGRRRRWRQAARCWRALLTRRAGTARRPGRPAGRGRRGGATVFAAGGRGRPVRGPWPPTSSSRCPPGGDAYVLSNILHDWPDEDCRADPARRARRDGAGRAAVGGREGPRPGPASRPGRGQAELHLLDLNMLVLFGARERTSARVRRPAARRPGSAPPVVHSPSAGPRRRRGATRRRVSARPFTELVQWRA